MQCMPIFECPTCKRQMRYEALTEVPFRPFCSQKCKLIDLGRWLNEEYRVADEPSPEEHDNQPGMDRPAD